MQIASDVVTGFCVFSCEVQIIVAYASTVNITQPNQSDKLTTDQTCFFGSKIFHTDYLSTSARHLTKTILTFIFEYYLQAQFQYTSMQLQFQED